METPRITDSLASPLKKNTPSITDFGHLRERDREKEREKERDKERRREREK